MSRSRDRLDGRCRGRRDVLAGWPRPRGRLACPAGPTLGRPHPAIALTVRPTRPPIDGSGHRLPRRPGRQRRLLPHRRRRERPPAADDEGRDGRISVLVARRHADRLSLLHGFDIEPLGDECRRVGDSALTTGSAGSPAWSPDGRPHRLRRPGRRGDLGRSAPTDRPRSGWRRRPGGASWSPDGSEDRLLQLAGLSRARSSGTSCT